MTTPFGRAATTALTIFVALLFLASTAAADTLYVKARYAKLRDGTTWKSKTVTNLKYGAPLTVVARKGNFVQVTTADGKTGWISSMRTATELKKQSSFLAGLGRAARGDGGGKDISYTAGARGLSSQAQTYAKDQPDLAAVIAAIERLEAVKITDEELDKFLQAGGLGDYRKGPSK